MDFVEDRGWAASGEVARIYETANSFDAIGTVARHAKLGTPKPDRPMTLDEANSLVASVLRAWLDDLRTRIPTR